MKISGDILRTYQSIHTWTGIVAGLVLFIGFYAGSLSMFEDEISHWATPSNHHLPQVSTEKFDSLIVKASSTFDKAQQGFTVNFNEKLSPLIWSEEGGGRGLQINNVVIHATLSEQGELITQINNTNELGDLIDTLHRTAGIVGKVGHEDIGVLILGIAAILYFLALVSGVIFLLPTLLKSFFALRTNKGVNRFWLDSHNLIGIISLPFHLIIALTVIVFAFHDAFYGGLSVAYGDKPLFERGEKSKIEYTVKQLPPIASYLEKVDELTDGYQVKSLEFTGLSSPHPSVGITIVNSEEMMRHNTGDFIYMNPYTYEISFSSIPVTDKDVYTPLVASFFSLHFGGFAGDFGRWIYFIMGLLGAFLFYSGNLIWLEKRRQKQPIQAKSNRVMASLTIGICLGSILAVVCTVLISKWLYILGAQINQSYLTCYYIVFFTAVFYSFVRGAAISAINLQQTLFIVCLFIPLTTLLTNVVPSLSLWPVNYYSSYIIELVALIFSGTFYYGSIKTKQRAFHGESNSIWSLPTVSTGSEVIKKLTMEQS
ncbi:MAG: PepSY domain-containing protein [Colwellia sp.]|nr:PepSY domain-containing protein [Colwellia sp.]